MRNDRHTFAFLRFTEVRNSSGEYCASRGETFFDRYRVVPWPLAKFSCSGVSHLIYPFALSYNRFAVSRLSSWLANHRCKVKIKTLYAQEQDFCLWLKRMYTLFVCCVPHRACLCVDDWCCFVRNFSISICMVVQNRCRSEQLLNSPKLIIFSRLSRSIINQRPCHVMSCHVMSCHVILGKWAKLVHSLTCVEFFLWINTLIHDAWSSLSLFLWPLESWLDRGP
jgi:hypothetical protein